MQVRKDNPTQLPPAFPKGGEVPTQERGDTVIKETVVQQSRNAPRTGGLYPLPLIGLIMVVTAVGISGWAAW